ncbi:hypothetical protein LIP81_21600, partial [Erysipelatoclostridium ramosum]|nr:hypothetical protein [Thomasclavelia ramosa]
VAYRQELEDARSGKSVTVGEYATDFQAKRRALGKVSSLTIERDQHEIDRIVKFLGDVRVVDLDAQRIEKAYLHM